MGGPKGRPSILIIDDDLSLLHMLEIGLQQDYDVVSAFSSKKALEVFREGDFDVVITDVMMPQVSGFEILESEQKLATPQAQAQSAQQQ